MICARCIGHTPKRKLHTTPKIKTVSVKNFGKGSIVPARRKATTVSSGGLSERLKSERKCWLGLRRLVEIISTPRDPGKNE